MNSLYRAHVSKVCKVHDSVDSLRAKMAHRKVDHGHLRGIVVTVIIITKYNRRVYQASSEGLYKMAYHLSLTITL